jgi:hypothetical protein
VKREVRETFYLRQAKQLAEIALETADPLIRVQLLEIAAQFRKLAEFVAAKEREKSDR